MPIITVYSNNQKFPIDCDEGSYQKIKKNTFSKGSMSLIKATLIPVRTYDGVSFSKDFFLPTLVNQVPRIKKLTVKIFAGFGALMLDLITFPVRLLTCVARVIYNCRVKKHPLYDIFLQKGLKPSDINLQELKLVFEREEKFNGVQSRLIQAYGNRNGYAAINAVKFKTARINLTTQPMGLKGDSCVVSDLAGADISGGDLVVTEMPIPVSAHLNLIRETLLKISELKVIKGLQIHTPIIEAKVSITLTLAEKKKRFNMIIRRPGVYPFAPQPPKHALNSEDIKTVLNTCCVKAFNRITENDVCQKIDYELTLTPKPDRQDPNRKISITSSLNLGRILPSSAN